MDDVAQKDDARNFRSMSEVEKGPRTGSRTRMLTTHEDSNHYVSNLLVSEKTAGTVFLLHKSCNHIMFVLQKGVFFFQKEGKTPVKKVTYIVITISPFLDDVNIKLAHLDMSLVSFPIAFQR